MDVWCGAGCLREDLILMFMRRTRTPQGAVAGVGMVTGKEDAVGMGKRGWMMMMMTGPSPVVLAPLLARERTHKAPHSRHVPTPFSSLKARTPRCRGGGGVVPVQTETKKPPRFSEGKQQRARGPSSVSSQL
jgi:hypothetical protein